MKIVLILLFFLYSTLPAYSLYLSIKQIWSGERDRHTWDIYYFKKYLITLSLLPLLFLPSVNLHLKPVNITSLILLVITVILIVVLIPLAKKKNSLQFYLSGSYAAFMEEILFRGVIFGIVKTVWGSDLLAIWLSSFTFGVWHLKNFPWLGRRNTIAEFFYTGLFYGPLFALLMMWTGDIYLSILVHYLVDASLIIFPKRFRIGNFVGDDDLEDIREGGKEII